MPISKTLTISKLGSHSLAAEKLEALAAASGVGKVDGKLTPEEFAAGKRNVSQSSDLFLDAERLEYEYRDVPKDPRKSWNPLTRLSARILDLFTSDPRS